MDSVKVAIQDNILPYLKEHQIPWGEYTKEDMQMDELALKKLACHEKI